jgi:hypothetical protein
VGAILGAEVSEEDDEGATFLVGEDAFGCLDEVAGLSSGLVIVEVVQEGGHGVRALHGFEPAWITAKVEDTNLIALAESDVGKQKHGVEAVIELGKFPIEGAHATTTIWNEQEGLVALFLVFATDEGITAGGGLPINPREDIAVLIVAQLLEVE